MAYQLSDIYIGNYPITQAFGARPDIYASRYGLKGHSGLDLGCPSLTMVLSAADGVIMEVGLLADNTGDPGGYGNYLKILHGDYLTLYGHLNDIVVKKGDHVVSGQLIAHSDNTGFSDGPHLHFGVAPCDGNGSKTEVGNGYSGYINPLDSTRCTWTIKNPSQPVNPHTELNTAVSIAPDDLNIKSVQANNFVSIVNYTQQAGLGNYLSMHGQSIDLVNNPADTEGAQKVNGFISSLIEEINGYKEQQNTPVASPVDPGTVQALPMDQKTSLLVMLLTQVKGFIFK